MAWAEPTADRLSSSHRAVATVALESRTGTLTPVDVLRDGSLTVTVDETTAPYVSASLSLPATSQVLAAADPLAYTHVVITTGHEWADGTTNTDTLCRLPLVSRATSRPGESVTLRAASVETLAQNYHFKFHEGTMPTEISDTFAHTYDWLVQFPTNGSTVSVPRAWPDYWFTAPPDIGVFYGTEIAIGDNLWSVLDAFGTALGGHKVYGDELGRWAGRTAGAQDMAHTTTRIAPGVNLIGSESTIAHAEYFNSVVDRYEYGAEDTVVHGRAYLASGPYSVLNSPERVKYTDHGRRYMTQSGANAAAARRVRNLAARRTLVTVEAIADYRLRPKSRVDLRLPTWSADESWVVQAVTFAPALGSMKLTLRRPIDTTATINHTGE